MTPIITATPGDPPTYSVAMAETFSWIPIQNEVRPLYAQASYITNLKELSSYFEEETGNLLSFNNHSINVNRGWEMDNTMRPMISIQNGSADAESLIEIVEYQIGNNNATQSTLMYEWYEGPLTINGAAVPAWNSLGDIQYRIYQDTHSNGGNTFSAPNGTYMRHSGIIIGRNPEDDEGPVLLKGGSSRNMLTLCIRRLDSNTHLDVWFAFTCKIM